MGNPGLKRKVEMTLKIEGEYSFTNKDRIKNQQTNITLHLRKRKKQSKNKPEYFLSVNTPEYAYISSLYSSPNKRQLEKINRTDPGVAFMQTNQKPISLFFDYQNKDYRLVKTDSTAMIEELK